VLNNYLPMPSLVISVMLDEIHDSQGIEVKSNGLFRYIKQRYQIRNVTLTFAWTFTWPFAVPFL